MRKEIFGVGTYVHIVHRGSRQASIVRDNADRWRFLKLLRYLNDSNTPRNWERDITARHISDGFSRPNFWHQPRPYVSIVAYCLMDNHFHLLVRESAENGISSFMQRLCTSMAAHFNAKYNERGSLFQGPYVARVVNDDEHLQYLATYIQVKNVFERYPGGLQKAIREFERAWTWANQDPFSSLADHQGLRKSSLLDYEAIDDFFPDRKKLSKLAQKILEDNYLIDDVLKQLIID